MGLSGDPENWAEYIIAMFQLEDAFWTNHSSFRSDPWKKNCALIGAERSRLLLTDLIMPALHAYFRLIKQEKYLSTVEKLYCTIPKNPTNKILKIMVNYCCSGNDKIITSAAEQQGLIHIYRSFCSPLAFQCRKLQQNRLHHKSNHTHPNPHRSVTRATSSLCVFQRYMTSHH